jgi:eukaryotic-like serine/threonine-protein kinase
MSSLHERAKELFLDALDRPSGDRRRFLDEACQGDTALLHEVESLLEFHEDEEEDDRGGGRAGTSRTSDFAPGYVFAGRYRMITRIGRGGMGDVWRADDLVLNTPVALKFIISPGPETRARILNEVRLARRITHPAVCRVFDFGEADDRIFFSMEFVSGEDLATVLKRVGRLPSEKVVDIAHQLCAGLAAAHAQRVLHRDLKPANVLIDDEGHVRITDFGIAVVATNEKHDTMVGTPGYMAPEQLVPGRELTERTDVYALGLVLYELLVGQHAFSRPGVGDAPRRPSTEITDVNPQLERIILQSLAPEPRDRPASAAAVASRLPRASAAVAVRTRKPWVTAAAAAAVVAMLAAAVPRLVQQRAGAALTEQDTIVLADFVNTTGDPVFDGTLKVALAVALEQSPFLRVYPDERVQETLRLMQRGPEERVTRAIAREIAQRDQLKALIAGTIAGLGTHYVISLEAVNATTGDVVAREQAEAPNKEQVLTTLGGATARLREKLGESLASVQKFDAPLARATTASLEALHSYSLALDDGRFVSRLEAIPHLKRALELDPDFALAQALMSGILNNIGRTSEAPGFSKRAFELRDRVSERERFFIGWRYYHDATRAWDKALELTRAWTATYPREAFAFNSLGLCEWAFGGVEQARAAFSEAIRLDPKFIAPYVNIIGTQIALNRFDEAEASVKQARQHGLNFISIGRMAYLVAFMKNDQEWMARELAAGRNVPEGGWASNWEARTIIAQGRLEEGDTKFRETIQRALQSKDTEFAAQWTVEDAEVHVMLGDCREVRRDVDRALQWSRDNFTLERSARVLALCDFEADARKLIAELASRFTEATLTLKLQIPLVQASLAVRRGEAERALDILDPLKPYDHSMTAEFWPAYLRGQAYLQAKDGRAAAAQFQSIVAHPGEQPTSPLFALAHIGLARAWAMAGDTAQAREAYQRFFKVWSNADPALPVVIEARREAGTLK